MGLSTKQVSGDHQGLLIEWGGGGGQTMLQSSSNAAELSKPPPTRRHPPPPQQQSEPPLKCPRCASTNTKFCYYNNYNKSQPRHFCKSCKRHWTKGGTLRNVPVGGGRKNKRPKISNSTTTTTTATTTAAAATGVRQEDKPMMITSNIGDHKSTSRILYESLIPTSSPLLNETRDCINIIGTNGFTNSTISTGLNISSASDQNKNTEFHDFTSLNSFDHMNASLGPTSYQSLNHVFDNLDSMEESTITTVNNIPSSCNSALWQGQNITTTSSLELPNYWNWNEIDDVLTSSDHLNISWDDHDHEDTEIKP